MTRKNPKSYPARKCIAIDIDGTLLIDGKLNDRLAEWIKEKHKAGYETILWSARGRSHALKVAQHFELVPFFSSIISKPGFIVDDMGWSWIKYTKRITRLE